MEGKVAMGFRFQKAPPNVTSQFSQDLKNAAFLGGGYEPRNEHHLPAYLLSLTDLIKLNPYDGIDGVVKHIAWQCIATVAADTSKVALGDVTPVSPGPQTPADLFSGKVRTTSFSQGPIINNAYQKALALSTDLGGDTACDNGEPRALRIPGLLVTLFWIKAPPGGTDLVVPINCQIPELKTQPKYTMQEFLTVAKGLAQHRLNLKTPD